MDPRITIALHVLDSSYNCQLKVTEVSKDLRLSRSHFERLFRRDTGRTFKAALQELRLCKALEFLKDPTMQVKEAAFLCGYKSAPTFTRNFKRRFGTAPSELRRSTSR